MADAHVKTAEIDILDIERGPSQTKKICTSCVGWPLSVLEPRWPETDIHPALGHGTWKRDNLDSLHEISMEY